MTDRIIIDPGHGGFDAGASYQNREEKNDNLRLALAVGQRLERAGYDVVYTRTIDQYDSPFDKAQIANNAQGDLFLSFHRNSSERPNQYHGVQALVYGDNPLANQVAEQVNTNLEQLGFRNIGTEQRKELVVLRRTNMPAVLLEVGFINSDQDNQLFDEKFQEIADAIASGVAQSLPLPSTPAMQTPQAMSSQVVSSSPVPLDAPVSESLNPGIRSPESAAWDPADTASASGIPVPSDMPAAKAAEKIPDQNSRASYNSMSPYYYYVQIGLFRQPQNAVYLMGKLRQQGYPVLWNRVSGLIAIWVGPKSTLDEAVKLQRELQNAGHDTLIVTDRMIQ